VLGALAGDALNRERVIAAVVRLLDCTGLRIGNDRYLRENHTRGLATISRKHATLHGGRQIELDFPGKGGKVWHGTVLAPRVARVVAQCQGIPGYRLFKYRDAAGNAHEIGSAEINQWLHGVTGNAQLTAKDFRTWHACVLFIEAAVACAPSKTSAALNELLTRVATQLGNTPAILKKSYIHPSLIDLWRAGRFAAPDWRRLGRRDRPRHLSKTEALFLKWLVTQTPSR
jgi:DNA topoisomerase-1